MNLDFSAKALRVAVSHSFWSCLTRLLWAPTDFCEDWAVHPSAVGAAERRLIGLKRMVSALEEGLSRGGYMAMAIDPTAGKRAVLVQVRCWCSCSV